MSDKGQTLAGLFYLRALIEQYMRKEVPNSEGIRRGDDLAVAYGGLLPQDFKDRNPSFSKVYSDISASMHEAKEDANQFQQSLADIEEHLEARPHGIKPIRKPPAPPPTPAAQI